MEHDLIGLDAHGALCSCGIHPASQIEHLGEVALALFPPESIQLGFVSAYRERAKAQRAARTARETVERCQRKLAA